MKRNIESLVELMRDRPAMYIGKHSITLFAMFLHGYSFAVYDRENMDDYSEKMGKFNARLTKKFGILDSLGWDGLILQVSNNDEEAAFKRFWIEWDEFCNTPEEETTAKTDDADDEKISTPPPP